MRRCSASASYSSGSQIRACILGFLKEAPIATRKAGARLLISPRERICCFAVFIVPSGMLQLLPFASTTDQLPWASRPARSGRFVDRRGSSRGDLAEDFWNLLIGQVTAASRICQQIGSGQV